MNTALPLVAITLGDPAGIGPEVAFAAACDLSVLEVCRPVLVGDEAGLPGHLESAPQIRPIAASELLAVPGGVLPLICVGALDSPVQPARVSLEAGRASLAWVKHAIELGKAGTVRAIVTAPINKKAWSLAGANVPGHTELFAEAFAPGDWAMMLTSPRISVGLCTLHVPLADAIASLAKERIVAVALLMHDTLSRILGRPPHLAVLGLNPHAGEEGLLGTEELRIISPALQMIRALGISVEGPFPPDTAFADHVRAEFDGFVCMYHDQGLIPFKVLAFEDGVNLTMGLQKVVRTSPDHGTAFDLVGTGRANPSSIIAATKVAALLATKSLE